jgi:hypothetical protein
VVLSLRFLPECILSCQFFEIDIACAAQFKV